MFFSRGSSGVPTKTVAMERGIVSEEDREIVTLVVVAEFEQCNSYCFESKGSIYIEVELVHDYLGMLVRRKST